MLNQAIYQDHWKNKGQAQWRTRWQIKLWIAGIGMITALLDTTWRTKPIIAQETTLAFCEAPSQTIRIYQTEGQTYLRAYDRQDRIVWMNTPASTETNPEGTLYKNLRGEQTVTLFAYTNGTDCSIQIGNSSPQSGRLSK